MAQNLWTQKHSSALDTCAPVEESQSRIQKKKHGIVNLRASGPGQHTGAALEPHITK